MNWQLRKKFISWYWILMGSHWNSYVCSYQVISSWLLLSATAVLFILSQCSVIKVCLTICVHCWLIPIHCMSSDQLGPIVICRSSWTMPILLSSYYVWVLCSCMSSLYEFLYQWILYGFFVLCSIVPQKTTYVWVLCSILDHAHLWQFPWNLYNFICYPYLNPC